MINILEQGDVFFLYRPRVEQEEVADLAQVQRLYMILNPDGRDLYRRLVVGRKRLPEPEQR